MCVCLKLSITKTKMVHKLSSEANTLIFFFISFKLKKKHMMFKQICCSWNFNHVDIFL